MIQAYPLLLTLVLPKRIADIIPLKRWCRSGAIEFYSFAVALSTPSDERRMNMCDKKSPSKLASL